MMVFIIEIIQWCYLALEVDVVQESKNLPALFSPSMRVVRLNILHFSWNYSSICIYMYFKPMKIRTGFRDLKFIFAVLELYYFPRWALVEAGAFQLSREQSVRRGSQPLQHQRHLLWKPGEDELGKKEIKIYIRNIVATDIRKRNKVCKKRGLRMRSTLI